MRRLLLLPILVALPLGGCLKVRATTKLAKDGGGTYTQVTTVAMEKARAYLEDVRRRARGLGLPPEEDEPGPFDAVDAEKRKAALATREGIEVLSSTQAEDATERTRTYELKVKFDSLRRLYAAGVVEDVSVKLERVRKGKAWKLVIRHVFEGSEREPLQGEAAERLREMRAAMLARFERWWGKLAIRSTLLLPTKVLDTNGVQASEGNEVSWRIGFADLADASKLVQEVTFAHEEGLKLEPFELSANDIANAIEEAQLEAAERKAKAAKDAKDAKKGKGAAKDGGGSGK